MGHGRKDTRKIEVLPAGNVRWYGIKQWGIITNHRMNLKTGEVTTEKVCFITSLGLSQASPEQLLKYKVAHWGIENKLHRTKDVLLCEDASTIRKNQAPQAVSALRNLVIYLLNKLHPSPKIAREIATYDINKAIQLLI